MRKSDEDLDSSSSEEGSHADSGKGPSESGEPGNALSQPRSSTLSSAPNQNTQGKYNVHTCHDLAVYVLSTIDGIA